MGQKKSEMFVRILWSEGREKKDAGTEGGIVGGKDKGTESEIDTEKEGMGS